jgi:hypothetical protein
MTETLCSDVRPVMRSHPLLLWALQSHPGATAWRVTTHGPQPSAGSPPRSPPRWRPGCPRTPWQAGPVEEHGVLHPQRRVVSMPATELITVRLNGLLLNDRGAGSVHTAPAALKSSWSAGTIPDAATSTHRAAAAAAAAAMLMCVMRASPAVRGSAAPARHTPP